jgi:hypothetical protein
MAVGLFICGNVEPGQNQVVSGILETLINMIDDRIVFFDLYKTDRVAKIVSNLDRCEVVKLDIKPYEDWKQVMDYYKEVITASGIDTLIFTKCVIFGGFTKYDGGVVRNLRKAFKAGNFKHSWTFESTKTILSKFLFVLSSSKICNNVYHYVVDPQEFVFQDFVRFKNFERIYYLDRGYEGCKLGFLHEHKLIEGAETKEKTTDFVFYATAVSKRRQFIADAKEELETTPNWDCRIIVTKALGAKERIHAISQNEYFDKLSMARYTLVIKSYDETTFSSWRFIEAAARGCLPFVYSDVCLTDMERTFPQITKIIRKHLLVEDFAHVARNIQEWPEEKRLKAIKAIQSTDDWKRISDVGMIVKQWDDLALPGVSVKEATK